MQSYFVVLPDKTGTGIAAALILYPLGSDENIITKDYLASGYYRKSANEKAVKSFVQYYKMDKGGNPSYNVG